MNWWNKQRSQSDRVHAARQKPSTAPVGGAPLLLEYHPAPTPTTRPRSHSPRLHGYAPPRRMVKWPFGNGFTVVMIVIPVFWPILGLFIALEVFCLLLYAALLVIGNLAVLVVWLVALAFSGR